MSERKSSRRKKYEKPVQDKVQERPSPVQEEKRTIYPTKTISIIWDYTNLKRKLEDSEREEIVEYYYNLQKKPASYISTFIQKTENYPDLPVYYDYLLLCYLLEENFDSAKEVAEKMSKRFANSLFGKVGFIELNLIEENLENIKQHLQEKFHYREIFPEKGVFHVVEVLHYWYALGKYLAFSGNTEKANSCLEEIKSIDPECILLKELQNVIDKASGVKFYQKIWRKLKGK